VQIVSLTDRAPDSLEQRLVVLPDPAPGEVRVAVRAVGVNPADYKSLERSWPRGAAVLSGSRPRAWSLA
jgi:NADPH:quinone reductase-like Zn-dependent oxidoreductase